jgi:hypothetical protein
VAFAAEANANPVFVFLGLCADDVDAQCDTSNPTGDCTGTCEGNVSGDCTGWCWGDVTGDCTGTCWGWVGGDCTGTCLGSGNADDDGHGHGHHHHGTLSNADEVATVYALPATGAGPGSSGPEAWLLWLGALVALAGVGVTLRRRPS